MCYILRMPLPPYAIAASMLHPAGLRACTMLLVPVNLIFGVVRQLLARVVMVRVTPRLISLFNHPPQNDNFVGAALLATCPFCRCG